MPYSGDFWYIDALHIRISYRLPVWQSL